MQEEQQRYRAVLKASSLIGGSAFLNIVIGMIRTKFVAVLIGPTGVGLMGMYGTLLGPISTVANMGVGTSGVREIAESHAKGSVEEIAKVLSALRCIVWATGVLGAIATVVLSPWLSSWTFGSSQHALPIAVLGITVFWGNIVIGQSCVLQGLRRIGFLAKIQVISAVNGTVISIPCFYLWGIKGVLPSMVLSSLAGLITSWWFLRRVGMKAGAVPLREVAPQVKRLLAFGIPLMASGLQGALTAYFLRVVIVKEFGLDGVGVWGAAFNVSGILVNFVLSAMSTDYFPRLSSVVHDNRLISKEVNAQTQIALLLALPALLATILFAPLGIQLLYSGRFDTAIPILRWSVYGILGRVISWPLGFIILAQGRGKLFFASELIMNLLHVGLIFGCSRVWGLLGTGIAFALLYTVHVGAMTFVSQWIAKTHWTKSNIVTIMCVTVFLLMAGGLHVWISSPVVYYCVSCAMFVTATCFVVRQLSLASGITVPAFLGHYFR